MADSIHELEAEAKHVKFMMDRLNKAYIGLTMEEVIRLAFENSRKEGAHENRDDDTCGSY